MSILGKFQYVIIIVLLISIPQKGFGSEIHLNNEAETLNGLQWNPLVQSNGVVNYTEIEKLKVEIGIRKNEILANLQRKESIIKGKSPEDVEKKLEKNKTLKRFEVLEKWLVQLEKSSRENSYDLALAIQELNLALKSEVDPDNTLTQILKHVKEFSKEVSISKMSSSLGEALNLSYPDSSENLTRSQVESLKWNRYDISLLEPPRQNGVLEILPEIAKIDPWKRYYQGLNPIHHDVKLWYPKDNVVYFDEVKRSQSKPKLSVYFKDEEKGKKRELKLKLAQELHSEPTSACLSNTIGIFSDHTRYERGIKLVLGETSYSEFKKDFDSYYGSYDLETFIKEKGQSDEGHYVIFYDGLFEPKTSAKKLNRAGPWYWGVHDHKYRREFRGLLLFNIWVHNTDLKEGENNKLLVKDIYSDSPELFYIQQDLGFSFGRYFRERPSDFSWSLIKRKSKDSIVFDYRNFQPNSGFAHVSYFDAKWMARKIAQLTPRQIEACLEIGGWPDVAPYNYRALYKEKLISRRNELVEAFDLVGEEIPRGQTIALLPVNREIEQHATASPKQGVPGYSVDFSPEIQSKVLDPLIEKVRVGLKKGTISLIGAINRITVEPDWLGWDEGVVAQIILNIDRNVIKNPNPTSSEDAFIVSDTFKIGARLGYGLVLSGDVAYVKHFNMIYPAADEEAALDGRRYLLDMLTNGYDQLQGQFPKKHILISESYLEGRGRLKLDAGPISIGFDSSISRFNLSRYLISRKNPDQIIFFEDESLFTETARRIYTKLVLLKITHYKHADQKGRIERVLYTLDKSHGGVIDKAMFENDFREIKSQGRKEHMSSQFWNRMSNVNFFGLWKWEEKIRRDFIEIFSLDTDGTKKNLDRKLLVDIGSQVSWKFLKNGEDHIKSVTFRSDVDLETGAFIEPVLGVRIQHKDKNTTNRELRNAYFPFVDGVTANLNFLSFTPELHSVSEGWGETVITTEVEYYRAAIDALLEIRESDIMSFVLSKLGLRASLVAQISDLDDIFDMDRPNQDQQISFEGQWYSGKKLKSALNEFISHIRQARSTNDRNKQIEHLGLALHEGLVREGGGFQPIVLRAVNEWVGFDSLYLSSMFNVPLDVENQLPAGIVPYNEIGQKKEQVKQRERLLFDLADAVTVYNVF